MSVNHLYFSNVANSATEMILTEELKKKWPEVFIEPLERGHLIVKMFKDVNSTSAVAYNLNVDFEKLSIEAESIQLFGRAIRVKPDTGEMRDQKTGKFLNIMTGVDHRSKLSEYGETSRKLSKIFTSEFLYDICYHQLKLQSKFLHLEPHPELTNQYLSIPGHVFNTVQQNDRPHLIKVEYGSILGAIQAVSLLSHRQLTPSHKIKVWNVSGTIQCNSIKAVGIGNPDKEQATFPFILDIDQYQKTFRYIPFSQMNPMILNNNVLSSRVNSHCWRCEKPFCLLGIDRRLGYIAGKCNCIYDSTIVIGTKNAYQWRYDVGFTRLVEGESNTGSTLRDLVIWHEPMKETFSTSLEYGRTILALLEEEWHTTSNAFKSEYKCEGVITDVRFVEQVVNKPLDIYGIKIVVPKTQTWTLETNIAVKKVALSILFTNNRSDEVDGRVWVIDQSLDPSSLTLSVSFKSRKNWIPLLNSQVQIVPKPDKTIYKSQRRLINNIMRYDTQNSLLLEFDTPESKARNLKIQALKDQINSFEKPTPPPSESGSDIEDDDQQDEMIIPLPYGEDDADPLSEPNVDIKIIRSHSFFHLFLPQNSNDKNIWKLQPDRIPVNPSRPLNTAEIANSIKESLTGNQRQATLAAVKNNLSIVQGPPGCGKTFFVSTFVLHRYLKESGTIILTASSNEACDNLAEAVMKRFKEFSIPPSLVRVISKSRENWTDVYGPLGQDGIVNGDRFPYLHKLIRNHPGFIVQEIEHVVQAITIKNEYRLTTKQKIIWDRHVRKLEKSVLSRFRIIVMTLATTIHPRLQPFMKNRLVSTLVAEESGQLTQPEILFLTLFNPARVLLVGDNEQLPATITSQSADRSGLGKSQLELSAGSALADRASILRQLVPWTTLDIQFRMEPAISKIVSELTYRGLLKNGPNIKSRPSVLPGNFDHDFAENSRSAVVFYDKRGKETKVGTSCLNIPEASEVCTLVGRILKLNVNPQHVVILTFYEAQRVEIIRQLRNQNGYLPYNTVRVMTVDSFQGREAPIVILSLVRSNSKHVVGFLNNPNRVNVAISRAMNYLFFVGDKSTFDGFNSGLWKNLMLLISRNGIVVKR